MADWIDAAHRHLVISLQRVDEEIAQAERRAASYPPGAAFSKRVRQSLRFRVHHRRRLQQALWRLRMTEAQRSRDLARLTPPVGMRAS